MSRISPTKTSRPLLLAFIAFNLLLCLAGLAGIIFLQNVRAGFTDPASLAAYNWWSKVLFGICSLCFDAAALSWYFAGRRKAEESGLLTNEDGGEIVPALPFQRPAL